MILVDLHGQLRTNLRPLFTDGGVQIFSLGLLEAVPDGSTLLHNGSYYTHLINLVDLAQNTHRLSAYSCTGCMSPEQATTSTLEAFYTQ